jgi:hypothetical protein
VIQYPRDSSAESIGLGVDAPSTTFRQVNEVARRFRQW